MATPEEILSRLDERLALGEISESTYREIKDRLVAKSSTVNDSRASASPLDGLSIADSVIKGAVTQVDQRDFSQQTTIGTQFSGPTTVYMDGKTSDEYCRVAEASLLARNAGAAERAAGCAMAKQPNDVRASFLWVLARIGLSSVHRLPSQDATTIWKRLSTIHEPEWRAGADVVIAFLGDRYFDAYHRRRPSTLASGRCSPLSDRVRALLNSVPELSSYMAGSMTEGSGERLSPNG